MILVIDNYDSFTYNLVQAVGCFGARVQVKRNDRVTGDEVLNMRPDGIILSPGPGKPEDAGNMPEIVAAVADRIPILGVCLGHQMIGLHFGARIVAAPELVHGKPVKIFHDHKTIYRGLPDPFNGGRYHSLIVAEAGLPDCLEVTCRAPDDEIMGLRHRELPIEGVQFHPESILTPEGEKLLANFLTSVNRNRTSL